MSDELRAELESAVGTAYTIERELEGGGMSRVFVATERALGRKVVIKVLPPDLAAGVNRDRFQREIQLAAQLQHPHIVPLLSAGEQGRLLWYIMPYIDGESLRAAIDRRGRLPVRDVLRIITDVTEALAFAHGRGVIHRDIKPGNVLMQGTHALVTDFGVAKALSAALPRGSGTTSGMAIGTPSYMAPEQLAADPSADHRADIYAVGLLAYELLSGQAPFGGLSPRETMASQLTRMPAPLEKVNPDVPTPLARIIARSLEKDPDRRYANAEELLHALEDVGTGATAYRRRGTNSKVWGVAALATVAAFAAWALSPGIRREAPVASDPSPVDPGPSPLRDSAVTVTVTPAPLRLTREDSLAIARAVEGRRSTAGSPSWSQTQIDSLKVQLERAMAESLARVMAELREPKPPEHAGYQVRRFEFATPGSLLERGPRPEPIDVPRGKLVAIVFPIRLEGAQDPRLYSTLGPVRDSLLRIVQRATGLDVIDVDSLSKMSRERGSEVAVTLRNSVQVMGHYEIRADSAVMRVMVRPPGWPVRGRPVSVESIVVPKDQPMAALESVASKVDYFIRQMRERRDP
jgi:serine/threonine-protein kinase